MNYFDLSTFKTVPVFWLSHMCMALSILWNLWSHLSVSMGSTEAGGGSVQPLGTSDVCDTCPNSACQNINEDFQQDLQKRTIEMQGLRKKRLEENREP